MFLINVIFSNNCPGDKLCGHSWSFVKMFSQNILAATTSIFIHLGSYLNGSLVCTNITISLIVKMYISISGRFSSLETTLRLFYLSFISPLSDQNCLSIKIIILLIPSYCTPEQFLNTLYKGICCFIADYINGP